MTQLKALRHGAAWATLALLAVDLVGNATGDGFRAVLLGSQAVQFPDWSTTANSSYWLPSN
ncbi:MAG: hypothetical protein OXD44_03390 [Gammaproteobacteria bacterium]|nr:hypothetical protein [Gammaproteobacteria bacterium]MCY4312737.1 hypothetical protein [Gammaproteobacteria bacterium]